MAGTAYGRRPESRHYKAVLSSAVEQMSNLGQHALTFCLLQHSSPGTLYRLNIAKCGCRPGKIKAVATTNAAKVQQMKLAQLVVEQIKVLWTSTERLHA